MEIVLPDLTESPTSVKIASWLKREGDPVVAGQPIVEIETDKTTVEIEAPASGVLKTICVPEGTEGVSVGTVLGLVAQNDSDSRPERRAGSPGKSVASDALSGEPERPNVNDSVVEVTDNQGSGQPVDTTLMTRGSIAATPLAARMAKLAGIDVSRLSASKGGARLRKEDIDPLLRRVVRPSGPPAVLPGPASMDPGRISAVPAAFDVMPLTPMRRVTAARLQQAKQQIPHFYLQVDCNVTELVRLRARLNAQRDPGLTFTDFLIVACALALRDVPDANAMWVDDTIRVYRAVDIALAVNTVKGLITPVVRGCQNRGLDEVSREVKRLIERARAGQLSPDEYNGGTFTISNLGMFGVSTATPILNPPQCCILGVGAIERRPVAVGDGLAVGDVMSCTLAADHRAIDGATGAELLHTIRRRLEDPTTLIRQHPKGPGDEGEPVLEGQ